MSYENIDYINPSKSQIHFKDGSLLNFDDLNNLTITKNGVTKLYKPRSLHHTSNTPEWYTPDWVLDMCTAVLGELDLDPACENKAQPNVKAKNYYDTDDDGLEQPWFGNVFCNPPYGRGIGSWVRKAVSEVDNANTILLVPARTDTKWFKPLWQYDILFFEGRIKFKGNKSDAAPFPSALVCVSKDPNIRANFLEISKNYGKTVNNND